MYIFYALEVVKELAQKQLNCAAKAERLLNECDNERLLSVSEKGMRSASDLYMAYREFILSLYEACPSLPRTVDISKVDTEAVKVSVDQVEGFAFPVYRITLPFLLPNKRKNARDYKTLITETVRDIITQFMIEDHIRPFPKATVVFLSYYDQNPMVIVDNDNKESAVIINALSGALIRDDNCACCNTVYYSHRVEEGKKTEIYIVDSAHDLELLTALKAKIIID